MFSGAEVESARLSDWHHAHGTGARVTARVRKLVRPVPRAVAGLHVGVFGGPSRGLTGENFGLIQR